MRANVDLRDLSLLAELIRGEHITKITGLAINDFKLDRKRNAIYRRLRLMESLGLVQRGFQVQQADKYFITAEGIKFYEEAIE